MFFISKCLAFPKIKSRIVGWMYWREIYCRTPNCWSFKQAKCKVSIENWPLCPLASYWLVDSHPIGQWTGTQRVENGRSTNFIRLNFFHPGCWISPQYPAGGVFPGEDPLQLSGQLLKEQIVYLQVISSSSSEKYFSVARQSPSFWTALSWSWPETSGRGGTGWMTTRFDVL